MLASLDDCCDWFIFVVIGVVLEPADEEVFVFMMTGESLSSHKDVPSSGIVYDLGNFLPYLLRFSPYFLFVCAFIPCGLHAKVECRVWCFPIHLLTSPNSLVNLETIGNHLW